MHVCRRWGLVMAICLFFFLFTLGLISGIDIGVGVGDESVGRE